MTTLDNGIVIDESLNAVNFTAAKDVPAVFGYPATKTGATIHHWGNDGQNIHNVARYLASANDRGNSATFVLQEDYVYCIVNSFDSSWHSGHPLGNASTIGIECRPEMTPGDLKTLASLIRFLESQYGDLTIYLHSEWMNTACPGRYAGKREEIVAMVNGSAPSNPPVVIAPGTPEKVCCCHD